MCLGPSKATQAEAYEIETGISISGSAKLVTGKKLKDPLNMTMMYAPEKGSKAFAVAKTDLDGNFTFRNLNVKEPTTAFIQGAKDNGSRSTTLMMNQYKWPQYKSSYEVVDPLYSDAEQMKLFLDQQKRWAEIDNELSKSKVTVLKEAVVKARKENGIDTRKILYEGTNFQTYEVKQEACATAGHVLQLLQGRIAGLTIMPQDGSTWIAIVRTVQSFKGDVAQDKGISEIDRGRMAAPVYLLDGMIIDGSFLGGITPCSVESIDVVIHPFPQYNAKGLVSIITKRANGNYDRSKEEARGAIVANIKGYEMARQFYSPKYASPEVDPKHVPDLRATLYWNPDVKTDANGNAKVTFWNSDEKTSVHVVLEGISVDGQPAYTTTDFKVE
jgi:hypothetical protein